MEDSMHASPFHPINLFNLFFFPKKYFASDFVGEKKVEALIAIALYGAARSIGQVEKAMTRIDMGIPRESDSFLVDLIGGSWFGFWALLLGGAVIGGFSSWWLGGWWFKVRVNWSGAVDPDPALVRQMYSYSSLVVSLPMIGFTLLQTLLYSDYLQAWAAEDWTGILSFLMLIFPFWVLFTAYSAVRTRFEVTNWKALFWFVFLQGGLYVIGYVGLIILAVINALGAG